jgi:hypothetical protein
LNKPIVQGLLQRVEHQIGPHRGVRAPADDATREHVDDERDVHKPAPRGDVREVRDPQLIGTLGVEVPLHQILREFRRGAAIVVRWRWPRTTPGRPSAAMSRATVQRATVCPSRNNCCQTLRTP